MNKNFLHTTSALILILNSTFAYELYNSQQNLRPEHNQYVYTNEPSRLQNNTHYHVYQIPLNRPGFQNNELALTSQSQTYGDTTYHTFDSPQTRRGFQ